MTIIRPNSISGINSITAKNTDQMKLYDSNGAWSHVRAGVITATKFVGPISGSTGTFGGDVTISGDLGVGGTITYEDVARVDATGISTFREGFHLGPLAGVGLTAYKDGSIRTSGIITAASFVGDGSGLTGAGPSLANGVNDRVVTASSATALNGEANLTFDGSKLKIGGAAVSQNRDLVVASNAEANLAIETHNDATSESANIRFFKSGNTGASPQVVETDDVIARLQAYGYDGTDYNNQACGIDFAIDGAPGGNDMPGKIIFKTNNNTTSPTNRLTIGADGQSTFDKGAPGGSNSVIARFQAEASRRLDVVWHDSGSYMGFDTPSTHDIVFKRGGNERARITDNGIAFASGKGLDFSATANGSNSSSVGEVLNDYEEGNFTLTCPNVNFGSLSGKYTKIGRIVHVSGAASAGPSSHGNANAYVVFGGFPFTASGLAGRATCQFYKVDFGADYSEHVTGLISGVDFYIYRQNSTTSGSSGDYLKCTHVGNNAAIYFDVTYQTTSI